MELREFIEELRKRGELVTVSREVSTDLEVGGLSAVTAKEGGPALLFNNIKGHPGFSMLGNIYSGPSMYYRDVKGRKSWSRLALLAEFEPTIRWPGLMMTMLDRYVGPIPSMEVARGPCQEVVIAEEDVDLAKLPIPLLHQCDSGRYGNNNVMMVKDIDSPWQEMTPCRWMPIAKDKLVANYYVDNYIQELYAKYESRGLAMPFCIVIGGNPWLPIAASLRELLRGADKIAAAGGFNLDPLEVVKAKTSDMIIPAYAEIVIEGEMLPHERAQEGPFAGLTTIEEGTMQPVCRVKTITHRTDPIFYFSVGGYERSDIQHVLHFSMPLELWHKWNVERLFPVMWMYMPLEFCLTGLVIAAPPIIHGYANWLATYCFSLNHMFDKVLVLDHTPPCDMEDIVNEWIRKANARRSYHYYKGGHTEPWLGPASPLVHHLSKEERKAGKGPRMYIDAHYPSEWTEADKATRMVWETGYPADIKEKVLSRWKVDYGIEAEPEVKE